MSGKPASEEAVASKISDETENSVLSQGDLSQVYQLIQFAEKTGVKDYQDQVAPLANIVMNEARFLTLAGAIMGKDVSGDPKKKPIQDKLVAKLGGGLEGVMKLANILKQQAELKELKTILKDGGVDDGLDKMVGNRKGIWK